MQNTYPEILRLLSHELKSPINSVIGFSDILNSDLDEGQKPINAIIRNSGAHMLHILHNYLNLSNIVNNAIDVKIKSFSVSEMIHKVLEMHQYPNNDELEIEVAGDYLDTDFIFQDYRIVFDIIENLISNAIKFTEQGIIKIVFRIDEQKNTLNLMVSDTGCGISDEESSKVFDENWRGSNPVKSGQHAGKGIGLTVVKGLVDFLGGEINLEPNIPNGTNFYFTIPLASENLGGYIVKTKKSPLNLAGKKVVIAEDDSILYQLLSSNLKEVNAEVFHARNGQELVDFVKDNVVDIIIVDMSMPVLNGPQAVLKIREFAKDVCIIALTANIIEKNKLEALDAGCNDYISKPVDIKMLHSIIENNCFNN